MTEDRCRWLGWIILVAEKSKNVEKELRNSVHVWYGVAYGVTLFLLLLVIIRIVYLQFVAGEELRARAERRLTRVDITEPLRGRILADDGSLLAISLPRYRLYSDVGAPSEGDFEQDVDSLAFCLAQMFKHRTQREYLHFLREERARGKRYVWLGDRAVSYMELKEAQRFPLLRNGRNRGGLLVEDSWERRQPLGYLARRTIGIKADSDGYLGLEGAYDTWLRGTPGRRLMVRGAGGRYRPESSVDPVNPVDGSDIVSTLNVKMQDVVTEALRKQLVESDALYGTAVIMEVRTGEVKAMANLERTAGGGYEEVGMNRAIEDRMELGSIFKMSALMMLLEDGAVQLEDTVDVRNGMLKLYGHVFKESGGLLRGRVTVRQAVENSSNVAFAELVDKTYKKRPWRYIERLREQRWGDPLGMPFSGEAIPSFRTPDHPRWSLLDIPMMATGYSISVSPLHMLAFYNAIANGGCMLRPRLVSAVMRDGKVEHRFEPEVLVGKLCSSSTLKKIQSCLEGVVERGTARKVRNEHYKVAGKTGTAQVARGSKGYGTAQDRNYLASFVGYFPAEAPRYSGIIVVRVSVHDEYYGGRVAAPIFAAIANSIYTTTEEWFPRLEQGRNANVPESKSGSAQALRRAFEGFGVTVDRIGEDAEGLDWVDSKREGGNVYFVGRRMPVQRVANVVGLPLSDAVYVLERVGLRVRSEGCGTVRWQSVQPGEVVVPGKEIFLEMSVQ